jgi:hypothetical protein
VLDTKSPKYLEMAQGHISLSLWFGDSNNILLWFGHQNLLVLVFRVRVSGVGLLIRVYGLGFGVQD